MGELRSRLRNQSLDLYKEMENGPKKLVMFQREKDLKAVRNLTLMVSEEKHARCRKQKCADLQEGRCVCSQVRAKGVGGDKLRVVDY